MPFKHVWLETPAWAICMLSSSTASMTRIEQLETPHQNLSNETVGGEGGWLHLSRSAMARG